MLYLYGDESNHPGSDNLWGIGFVFSTNPSPHMSTIARLRKECGYELRELKYSSTDYRQILFAIRVIDYFLSAPDLYFKVIIKDIQFFRLDYFDKNSYGLDKKDLAYVSAYSELCRTIKPEMYAQKKKLLNIDDRGFKGNVILPQYLKHKDSTIVNVYRRDSKERSVDQSFTGVSNMIQLADFLTGVVLSIAEKRAEAERHKNIYRKALLSKCNGLLQQLEKKQHYCWPDFNYKKFDVFYSKQKNLAR